MSARYYLVSGTQTTLLSTELNALATSATLAAGAISSVGGTSGLFNNTQGGGGLGGYTQGRFTLALAAPAGAVAGTVNVAFARNDGTATQDGSASIIPSMPWDLVLPVRAVTSTAQLIEWDSYLPPGNWFVLLSQATGQAFAATGNTLKVVPFTDQFI